MYSQNTLYTSHTVKQARQIFKFQGNETQKYKYNIHFVQDIKTKLAEKVESDPA